MKPCNHFLHPSTNPKNGGFVENGGFVDVSPFQLGCIFRFQPFFWGGIHVGIVDAETVPWQLRDTRRRENVDATHIILLYQ